MEWNNQVQELKAKTTCFTSGDKAKTPKKRVTASATKKGIKEGTDALATKTTKAITADEKVSAPKTTPPIKFEHQLKNQEQLGVKELQILLSEQLTLAYRK